MSTENESARNLLAVGRADDAVAVVVNALGTSPDDVDLRCLLAQAHLVARRPAEALDAAGRAAALDPEEEWAQRLRSIALSRLGRHREAVGAGLEAVRLAPALESAHHVLAEAYLGAGQHEAARREALEVRRLRPRSADAHDLLGRCLTKQRQYAAAEAEFRRALEIDAGHAAAHNNLGVALQKQGRRREAIDAFHAAAQLNPTIKVARDNLYSGTRVLVGGGVFLILLLLRLPALVSSMHNPFLSAVAMALVVAGLVGVGIRYRRRARLLAQLPAAVVTFYAVESRRRRPWESGALLFRLGGCAAVSVATVMLTLASGYDPLVLLTLPVAVGWLRYSPRLWTRLFAPRE